ncbi:MAG: SwmB domain-containing protein [Acidobacteria bacterium]|nr:SwmB domain-containing protein [Acidobacteriota bacterium]
MPRLPGFLALLLTFVSLPAAAVVYLVPPDEALVDDTPFIVYGEVFHSMPAPEAGFTDALVRVEAQMKGRAVNSVITVRQLGGIVGDMVTVVRGLPMLGPGQRVLLFLEPGDDGVFETVSWGLGTFFEHRGVLSRYGVAGDAPRSSTLFREWIGDRVLGVDRLVDYSTPSSRDSDGPQSVTSAFTLRRATDCGSSNNRFIRWTNFDNGGNLTVTIHGAQPRLDTGTRAAVDAGVHAWNAVPGSTVSLKSTISAEPFPTRTSPVPGVQIGFNDPHNEVPGSVYAVTLLSYPCRREHTIPGSADSSYQLEQARIITNNFDFSDHLPSVVADLMTHQLGHALGLDHPCDSRACTSEESDSIMRPIDFSPQRRSGAARLGIDDQRAIQALYPERQVSVTPSAAVTEGTAATFTIRMSHASQSATTVELTVSQTGDFVASSDLGAKTVSVPADGQVTYTVPTVDDSNDEVAGAVTVTVTSGTGYTVPDTPPSESVNVHDNDNPPSGTPLVSIAGGAPVSEGTGASFTIRAAPTPSTALSVKLVISQTGDFVAASNLGEKTVTVPTTGEATYTVPTVDDDTTEDSGLVTATLVLNTGYGLHNVDSSTVHVTVDDPDRFPRPVTASVYGRKLTVAFSENLDGMWAPASSVFTVTATPLGNSGRTIVGDGLMAVRANTATVPLAGSVAHGETLTVDYAKPSSRPLQDEDRTEVAGFTGLVATNRTPPAPAGMLVSNTDQFPGPSSGLSAHLAHSFTTGGYAGGSRLISVDVPIAARPASGAVANVDIVNAMSGRPGSTVLATLTPPPNLVVGLNRFTAPGERGIRLAASTEYFVVLRLQGADTGDWQVSTTGSDGEDPGNAAGWHLANDSYSRAPGSSVWALLGGGSTLKIAVNGYAERSKVLASNSGQASAAGSSDASFSNDHGQPFTTGSNSNGYRVTSVDVETDIATPGNSTDPTYTVSIRSDSSGDPGTELVTLTNPATLVAGANTFTASSPGVKLDTSTKYFLLVDVSAAGNKGVNARRTASDAEDAGAATGWTIGDSYRRKGNTATAWADDSNAMKVTVRGHGVGPIFERAEVNRGHLIVIFDGHVTGNLAVSSAAFDLIATNANGESRGIGGTGAVTTYHNELNVPLALEVAADETVTLTYTPPASQSGAPRDASGNWVDGFSNKPVTNRTPAAAAAAPVFKRAGVRGNRLVVIFDAHVSGNSSVPGRSFNVVATNADSESRSIGGTGTVSMNRNEANVTLALAVAPGETVTASYTPIPGHSLTGNNGNWVNGFSNRPVTNNSRLAEPPVFKRAEVRGSYLIVIFDGHVNGNSGVPGSAFNVVATNADGASRSIGGLNTAVIYRSEVNVKLALAVAADETVKLTYTPPAARALSDDNGNLVNGFSSKPVANESPAGNQ